MNYKKLTAMALVGGALAVVANIPARANQMNDMLTMQAAQAYAAQHGGYLPYTGGTLPSYLGPNMAPIVPAQYGYPYNPYYTNVPYYYNNVTPPTWHHHYYW